MWETTCNYINFLVSTLWISYCQWWKSVYQENPKSIANIMTSLDMPRSPGWPDFWGQNDASLFVHSNLPKYMGSFGFPPPAMVMVINSWPITLHLWNGWAWALGVYTIHRRLSACMCLANSSFCRCRRLISCKGGMSLRKMHQTVQKIAYISC